MVSKKSNKEEEEINSLEESNPSTFIAITISTFTGVFFAELGDKTQIATLLLSAQSGKPVIVFIGSSLALICSSIVCVLLGRWLANNLPEENITILAGSIMLILGLSLGFQSIQSFAAFN